MPWSVNRLPFALQPLSRIQVLLLLLLPALCVPRGVLLGFCPCDGPTSGCCAEVIESCCSTVELSGCAGCCGGDADGEQEHLVGVDDCACRTTIEIEEFEELSPGAPTALEHAPLVALDLDWTAPRKLARLGRVAASRAPPCLLPPGLRPGAAPLLL